MTENREYLAFDRVERSPDFLDNATRYLLTLFVFTIPWENAIIIPGVGTVGRFAGACAFILSVLAVSAHRHIRVPSLTHVLMALFVLWSAVTLSWTLSPELGRDRVVTYLQLFVMIWQIWHFADKKQYQVRLVKAYVCGSFISIGSTIWNYESGASSAYMRYSGSGFDPNDATLILALSLVMSIYIVMETRNGPWAWISYIHVILVIAVVFLTASRGQLFAVVVALSLAERAFRSMPSAHRLVALLVILGGGVVVAPLFIPKASLDRLGTIGSELQHGTLNERRQIWEAGLRIAAANPVAGVGTGAFPSAIEPVLGAFVVAHNTFISILVETGIVGLSIFLATIISLAAIAYCLDGAESRFLLTLLATWCIGVCSLTWDWRKPTWFVFGLIAAMGGNHFSRRRRHE